VGGTNTGGLELSIEPPEPGFDWPAPLQSCADLLAIDLPQFDSADGSSVAWTKLAGFDDPAFEQSREESVSGGKATFTYATVDEPQDVHDSLGPELSTAATVQAQVGLPGLENLGSTIANGMNAPLAGAAIGVGAGPAATLLGPSVTGSAAITFHVSDAVVDSDVGFEHLYLTTDDGAGPNGTWSGTLRMVLVDVGGIACGPAQEKPITLQFTGGSAQLVESFAFGGGVMQSCSMSIDETVTIVADGFGGAYMQTSGTYQQVIVPPPPGEVVTTDGVRNESYTIEFLLPP
jgi:hypothetical protein